MRPPGRVIRELLRAVGFAPLGFSGATAPSRYVGGTTVGVPTSGAYQAGDLVTSADGTVGVCRVSGEPGSWSSSVTNNTDQSISGVKTFAATPVVPSLDIGGAGLTVSGGRLLLNGRAIAFVDELADHTHGGTTGAASAGTAHTHSVVVG